MRTDWTASELALIASGHFVPWVRVRIADADGTLRDYTNQSGKNFLIGGRIRETVDDQVAKGTIRLRREVTGSSIAPAMETSLLNRNAANDYAPALDLNRSVLVEEGVSAKGASSPIAWRATFEGRVTSIDPAQSEAVVLGVADLGDILTRAILEDAITVGSEGGTPLHEAMQDLLDQAFDAGWIPATTLTVPVEPDFVVVELEFGGISVMDALVRLAQHIGWDVRYWWNATDSEFQLTLLEPDRDKTTPDFTVGPDGYLSVDSLSENLAEIRNRVRVLYIDSADGKQKSAVDEDEGSVEKYGVQFLQLDETGTSINTQAEAEALRDAVLADLSQPGASQRITTLSLPHTQLRDLIEWEANDVHYSTDQSFAVTAIERSFDSGGRIRCAVECRGAVLGQLRQWRQREFQFEEGTEDYTLTNFRDIRRTSTEVEFGWDWGAAVEDAAFWITEQAADVTTDPWPSAGDPPDTVVDAADPASLIVPVPPAGSLTYIEARARWDGGDSLGPRWRGVITPAAGIILEYMDVDVTGTVVTVYTDEAGLSIKLERTDTSGWVRHEDVGVDRKIVFDVSEESAPGEADEIGVGETWTMLATVYVEPVAEVGVGTPEISQTVIVSEATASPARWVRNTATAPAIGDDEIDLTMHASDVPGSVEVWWRYKEPGLDYTTYARIDNGVAFDPDPNVAPDIPDGVEVAYTFQSTFTRQASGDVPTSFDFRFDLKDGGGAVIGSVVKSVSYYAVGF